MVLAYRQLAFAYALTSGAVFFFTAVLARLTVGGDRTEDLRWRWSSMGLILLVGAFIVGQGYQRDTTGVLVGGSAWALSTLGMWLPLRLVTFLWEFGSGRIAHPSLSDFTVWICMPFTQWGPLLRYSQFEAQRSCMYEVDTSRVVYTRTWVLNALTATGLLLCGLVLSTLQTTIYADGGQAVPYWAKLMVAFGISPWSFLLTWAGFSKLMECLALMWGLKLPASFNAPFGRPNLSEFWANWNMTVTSVFRDYLFYSRWRQQKANLYVNTLIIFFLVGLWHGVNSYWIIWGLLHGIGFCCFIWYKQWQSVKRLTVTQVPMRLVGRVSTYKFVCACWVVPSQILKLFGRVTLAA